MNLTKLRASRKRVDASIREFKRVIAKDIAKIIQDRGLTQTEAAALMQDAPSQVSLVVTGKLRGFSTERLLRMRALLGAKIRIVASDHADPQVVYLHG